jgi:branched-chain amino acid transport system substrate-binding protein
MRLLLLAIPLLLPLLPFNSLAEIESTKEITIGVSLPLSGPWASWGDSIRNGLTLATKERKEGLRLQFQDDRCDPKNAVTVFNKFLSINKMPIIILGCMENIPAVLPLTQNKGAFVFTLGSMETTLLNSFPNLLSLYTLADAEVYYILPYARDVDNIKTMTIVSHAAAVGEAVTKSIETHAPQVGITIVKTEVIALEEKDLLSIVPRVIRSKADALYVHLEPKALGTFVKKVRELGYQGKIYSRFLFESEDSIATGGNKIEGVRYTYPTPFSDNDQLVKTFTERYRKEFAHSPDSTAMFAYDTGKLLDQVLTTCAAHDHACLTSFFATLGAYNGIGGKVTFRKDRSALRPFGLKEYKNGAFTWIARELKPLE